MYEEAYDLTEPEKIEVREILAEMSLRGGRLTDSGGRPIAYRVLGSRRFLVCEKGLVWRFVPEGSPKRPGKAGAAVRRNSVVEMWTGKWRKAKGTDGEDTYAKCLVWVPLDDNVNGHAGISKLGWYRSEKGFRHPLEEPHAPDEAEISALEGRERTAVGAVYARMQAEGLNVPDDATGSSPQARRARRRAARRAS